MSKHILTPEELQAGRIKGGKATTNAKRQAARSNGRWGGRPPGTVTCNCGQCKTCYNREKQRQSRARRRRKNPNHENLYLRPYPHDPNQEPKTPDQSVDYRHPEQADTQEA